MTSDEILDRLIKEGVSIAIFGGSSYRMEQGEYSVQLKRQALGVTLEVDGVAPTFGTAVVIAWSKWRRITSNGIPEFAAPMLTYTEPPAPNDGDIPF